MHVRMASPAEAVSCSAILLANPDNDILQNPTKYVNMFLQDNQFAQRVQDYIQPQGTLVHHKHVFEWWFCLFMDRLDIKLAWKLPLDPHERIIATVQNMVAHPAEEYAVINYFGNHVVPGNDFSAAQIWDALDDPTRWKRRDEQDKILLEQDPSGASLDAFNIARLLDAERRYLPSSVRDGTKHCFTGGVTTLNSTAEQAVATTNIPFASRPGTRKCNRRNHVKEIHEFRNDNKGCNDCLAKDKGYREKGKRNKQAQAQAHQGSQVDLRAPNTPALVATDRTSPGTTPPISTPGNNAYSTIVVDHAFSANRDRIFEPAETPIHGAISEYN